MKPASPYQAMWLFALFDLPVHSKKARRDATRFRHLLLREGFTMLQFSVYARYFESEEAATAAQRAIHRHLPGGGQVRLLAVTEKQFARQQVFNAGKPVQTDEPPPQMLLF